MTHVYTRERHQNKNTRFWATYGITACTPQVTFKFRQDLALHLVFCIV